MARNNSREEIMDFLFAESELLDSNRLEKWIDMLTEDVVYTIPIRRLVARGSGEQFDMNGYFAKDDYKSLMARVARLKKESAWTEEVPSPTRHFISNIRIEKSDEGETTVKSNVLVLRYSNGGNTVIMISGERLDKIVNENGKLKLSNRTVFLDRNTLNSDGLTYII